MSSFEVLLDSFLSCFAFKSQLCGSEVNSDEGRGRDEWRRSTLLRSNPFEERVTNILRLKLDLERSLVCRAIDWMAMVGHFPISKSLLGRFRFRVVDETGDQFLILLQRLGRNLRLSAPDDDCPSLFIRIFILIHHCLRVSTIAQWCYQAIKLAHLVRWVINRTRAPAPTCQLATTRLAAAAAGVDGAVGSYDDEAEAGDLPNPGAGERPTARDEGRGKMRGTREEGRTLLLGF
ncbi:hypothetical protein PRIPAC_93794 [Pristionchus pacificus]|uniref:Uncharacterized protein n=1 Tax=Pristionchus pacificus TaxID=54126 RepID=A0A2A6CE90_PRIPA|nr:hypothetical protein PRIPAC_93794 [Pristionchus pacificus]|eukprot:PDM76398.1 hypothetical protein PRIPAC_40002 [Pristionchus pacificus]